jgi:hypothetical protein
MYGYNRRKMAFRMKTAGFLSGLLAGSVFYRED